MEFKSLSPWHCWVCSRVLEGTLDQGPEVGVWSITAQRFLRGWGGLNDEDYPFDMNIWPPKLIEGDLQKAKSNRTWCYQIVRDAVDGCNAIDRNRSFTAAFEITDQWFNAEDGIIAYPPTGNVVGGHSIAFRQYSKKSNKFSFVNSWGENWGHRGHGLLGFDFFNDYQLEGFCAYLTARPQLDYKKEYECIRLGYIGFAGILIHICEIYNHIEDENLAWAFVVQRDGYLDIEELYVKPRHRGIGLGNELITMIQSVKTDVNLPLRAWISHADNLPESLTITDALLLKLGLRRQPSPMRWAAYLATEADSNTTKSTNLHLSPNVPRMFFKTK